MWKQAYGLSSWFGLHGSVLNWFESYLSSRSFHDRCNNTFSSLYTCSYGVPQGSVLGPLLFIMYTTPLSTLISSLSLNHHLYADDTQLFNGSIARSASCRYLIYSEADFEFFCPAGVKFGMEEGTKGPLLHAKFHPHLFNDKGVGSQKLKFLLRFDQNVAYKCPAGACPLRDFHKIRRVCTSF